MNCARHGCSQYKDYVLFMLFINTSLTNRRLRWFRATGCDPKGVRASKNMVALTGDPDIGTRSTPGHPALIDANSRLAVAIFPIQ